MKKVLFVGGGRRYDLAKRFKDREYEVASYEIDDQYPVMDIGDWFWTGRRFDEEDVVEHLSFCIEYIEADLVLPLMDAAIPVVAKTGYPVSSDLETAEICADKILFENFMLNSPLRDYYPYANPYDNVHKLIEKPALGFGSRGVSVYDKSRRPDPKNVYQMFITGNEYSVDAYFNKHSVFVDCVARQRIRVAGGEVLTSAVISNQEMERIVKVLGEDLGIKGPCNMQFIVDKDSKPWIIEVNARFGGGWTFSMEAGLDAISLLENDYLGTNHQYTPGNINKNLWLERSYRDHYFEV